MSYINIRHWVYMIASRVTPVQPQHRWSIARLALCIIQISYANSVINNAGTKRFIIPRNQRRLNTVDLHANSPNEEAALALKAAGQFLSASNYLHTDVYFPLFTFIATRSMSFLPVSVNLFIFRDGRDVISSIV